MTDLTSPFSPEQWMANALSDKAIGHGQMIRRKLGHIDRMVGRETFIRELTRRGWHAVENGDQMVIFCDPKPVRVIL